MVTVQNRRREMNYSLEQQDAEIVVRVDNAGEQAKQFLEGVRSCGQVARQGCAVECGKIAAITEASHGGAVVLRMVPRAGERIEINVVRRCLTALSKSCGIDESDD